MDNVEKCVESCNKGYWAVVKNVEKRSIADDASFFVRLGYEQAHYYFVDDYYSSANKVHSSTNCSSSCFCFSTSS